MAWAEGEQWIIVALIEYECIPKIQEGDGGPRRNFRDLYLSLDSPRARTNSVQKRMTVATAEITILAQEP